MVAGSTATIKALTALPAQAKAIDAIGGGLTGAAQIHVTLTDDHPWAQAFVIIEAIKD